nr:hypothetical protein [Thalassobacillus cyri]
MIKDEASGKNYHDLTSAARGVAYYFTISVAAYGNSMELATRS